MRLICQIILVFCMGSLAWTQYVISVHAGLINYAEGSVFLDKEYFEFRVDQLREMKQGQRLRTAAGKVEVQLGPAASLWMDENGSLRMDNPGLTETRLVIEKGSVFIEIIEKLQDDGIMLQLGNTEIQLNDTGLYHIESVPPQIYVFDGKAKIGQQQEKETVKRGRCAELEDEVKISKFDMDRFSPLKNWVKQRSQLVYGRIKNAQKKEIRRRLMESRILQQEVESLVRRQMQQQQLLQQMEER